MLVVCTARDEDYPDLTFLGAIGLDLLICAVASFATLTITRAVGPRRREPALSPQQLFSPASRWPSPRAQVCWCAGSSAPSMRPSTGTRPS